MACDECCCAWCVRCADEGVGLASWEDGRGRWDGNEKVPGNGLAGCVSGGVEGVEQQRSEVWETAGKRLARIKRRKWEV